MRFVLPTILLLVRHGPPATPLAGPRHAERYRAKRLFVSMHVCGKEARAFRDGLAPIALAPAYLFYAVIYFFVSA